MLVYYQKTTCAIRVVHVTGTRNGSFVNCIHIGKLQCGSPRDRNRKRTLCHLCKIGKLQCGWLSTWQEGQMAAFLARWRLC